MTSSLSFIEPNEIEEAAQLVESLLGFPAPKARLDELVVKIYVRPEDLHTFTDNEGNTKSIYLPEVILAHDKFRNATALVVSVGPNAYSHIDYKECGPYVRPGDWIFMPRAEGVQMNYRGVPFQRIKSNVPWLVVEDPSHADKFENF